MLSGCIIDELNCEFSITSRIVAPEEITKQLAVQPSRCFTKGDTFLSEHSGLLVVRPYHLWAITSTDVIEDKEDLRPHIDYLKSKLSQKYTILKQYREDHRLELVFSIWIKVLGESLSFILGEHELAFIGTICNRCDYFFLAKETNVANDNVAQH